MKNRPDAIHRSNEYTPIPEEARGTSIVKEIRGEAVEALTSTLSPHFLAVASNFVLHDLGGHIADANSFAVDMSRRIDLTDIAPDERVAFESKAKLCHLFGGQSGRDLRRELLPFEQVTQDDSPDTIGLECRLQLHQFQGFLRDCFSERTMPVSPRSVLRPPLSEALTNLLKNPVALYEQLIKETVMLSSHSKRTKEPYMPRFYRQGGTLETPTSKDDDGLAIISARKATIAGDERLRAPVKKWIQLILPVFRHAPRELGGAILDTLGFIPDDLYTKKQFSESIAFRDLCRFHDLLREWQEGKAGLAGGNEEYNRQRVLNARAQLLRHLFLSGIAETAHAAQDKSPVTIDVNGVWINLIGSRHREQERHVGIHAHLPFAYVTDDLIQYWIDHEWIPEKDAEEMRLRRAHINNDVVVEASLEQEKRERFAEEVEKMVGATDDRYAEGAFRYWQRQALETPDCPDRSCAHIVAAVQASNHFDFARIATEGRARFPVSALRYYLSSPGASLGYKAMAALNFAERLQRQITTRSSEETQTIREAFADRSKNLNDPRHYDAMQIAGAVLEGGIPAEEQEGIFRAFCVKAGEYYFLELIQYGRIIRVLLNPGKLTQIQWHNLCAMRQLSLSEAEVMESEAHTIAQARQTVAEAFRQSLLTINKK